MAQAEKEAFMSNNAEPTTLDWLDLLASFRSKRPWSRAERRALREIEGRDGVTTYRLADAPAAEWRRIERSLLAGVWLEFCPSCGAVLEPLLEVGDVSDCCGVRRELKALHIGGRRQIQEGVSA